MTNAHEDETGKTPFFRASHLTIAVVALSILFVAVTLVWADRSLRIEFLERTQSVAQKLDIEQISALTGTASDLESADYKRTKERFVNMHADMPDLRFLYLMGRRDGGPVVFMVDSEAVGTSGYTQPGDVYDEVSKDTAAVFETQVPYVDGPVADRWGEWITGLVPVDTTRASDKADALRVVLGMDIDYEKWRKAVFFRAAYPIGAFLTFGIIGICILFLLRRAPSEKSPILRRLLPPFALIFIVLMLGASTLFWQQHKIHLNKHASEVFSEVLADLRRAFAQETKELSLALQPIVINENLKQAIKDGNKQRLLTMWQPLFEKIRQENNVTHLYFMDKDRVILLRAHNPEKSGDTSERFTSIQSQKTNHLASGIELGRFGTFTLRVVQPVFDADTLVGFVELGKEIDEALSMHHSFRSTYDLQISLLIYKKMIDRAVWKARNPGKKSDWDFLDNHIVFYDSEGQFPQAFAPMMNVQWDGRFDRKSMDEEIFSDGKSWRMHVAAFQDASGQDVGDLVIRLDVTKEKAEFRKIFAIGSSAGLFLLFLLVIIAYDLLRRTDKVILSQKMALEDLARRAEAASIAKSDFLANMSHEVRTPMNGIMGMIDLILDTKTTKQQREWLAAAYRSAEGLLDIINDILDLSKIEADKMTFEHIPYDVHATIETVTDLLYLRAADKGLKLIVHLPDDLPRRIFGDPLRLRQVLMNLIGNAIKFTPSGHVLIKAQDYPDLSRLRIEIEDTGIGVPEEKQAHIFGKFNQETSTTTRRFGGTGLGLAISKKLVEGMGGSIGVISQTNKGSTFWLEIPYVLDTASAPYQLLRDEDLKLSKTLIVEPYGPRQMVLESFFKSWGMACASQRDAREAVRSLSQAASLGVPFHFLIVDIDPSKSSWQTLLDNIAPLAKARKILVIASVPPDMPLDQFDFSAWGVAGVVNKPVYASHLFDMLMFTWQRRKERTKEVITKITASNMGLVAQKQVAPESPDFNGMRILLAEDHPVNLLLMQTILTKVNCLVDAVENGTDALYKYKENAYDLIFMDCQMPQMDGYEATRAIREYEAQTNRHVIIVALTANAMQGDREKCLKEGMDDYLSKPVKPDDIHTILKRYMPL